MFPRRATTVLIPLLFFCCPVLAAQPEADALIVSTAPESAAVSTVTAAATAFSTAATAEPGENILKHPEKYYEDLFQTVYHLSSLLERWEQLDAKLLADTAKDAATLDEKLKALLGPAALKELDEKDRPRREAAGMGWANGLVANVRQAIQAFNFDSDGAKFPRTPAELSPKYLDAMPWLNLPWHGKTSAVTLVETAKFDKDFSKAVKDTGGWLYFADPRSDNWGMLVIDCSHKDLNGTELYKH